MQRCAGQVNAMPACRRLINHTLLHRIDVAPGGIGWTRQPDALAAVRETRESLIRDARTLIFTGGTGMAEAAMLHIPAMQPRTRGQRVVPGERIQPAHRSIMIDQVEKLLRQLC